MDLLESIEELSDLEKAYATSIMKSEVNREIFINFKNPTVCLLWIKGEIAPKVIFLLHSFFKKFNVGWLVGYEL
jgi:hypothetical protein